MIEQALRNFCESRYRSLIVIAGTFIVGLVLVLPLVDAYCAGLKEREDLLAELESAEQVAAGLLKFEARVAERLNHLEAFQRRTVDDESLPVLRGNLVDLAKETGCSIRRLSVGATASRPWAPGENPVAYGHDGKRTDGKSGSLLEWRPISISLSGTSASLRAMVERVASAGMLMHTKSLEMYPSSPTRQSLTLDMELWYFTLARRS